MPRVMSDERDIHFQKTYGNRTAATKGGSMSKVKLGLILAVMLLAGCYKKHEDGSAVSPGGTLPGSGSTVTKTYTGAVTVLTACLQDCKQTIPVNADVIDFPSDAVNVYLCRNADCATSAIPQTLCATVWDNPTAPCSTQIPNPDIILAKNAVIFENAFKSYCIDQACSIKVPGYSSYVIQTTITR